MAEVFSESEQGVFRLAKQLELCGERALALELCEKCVRRAALCRGQDVLVLFYGENVYRGLRGIGDAMEYVFIARCAARVYDAVAEKTSVARGGNAWAKRASEMNNKQLAAFFRWLEKPDRPLSAGDGRYFHLVLEAMKDPDRVFYTLSARLMTRSFLEIVQMLVSHEATVSEGGGLQ